MTSPAEPAASSEPPRPTGGAENSYAETFRLSGGVNGARPPISPGPGPFEMTDPGVEGTITTLHTTTLSRLPGGITHAFSTKPGGVSPLPRRALNLGRPQVSEEAPDAAGSASRDSLENIEENRRRFFAAAGLAGLPTVSLRQAHGDAIHFVERLPSSTLAGDGVFTDRENLVVGVGSADCAPILFAEREGRFVGAVHAGWRGAAKRIAEKAAREACLRYGAKPRDLFAAVGPCIHACCYEVRGDVVEAFREAGLPRTLFAPVEGKEGAWTLDLVEANVRQLLAARVPPENIEVVDRCTFCEEALFFSYRRDGAATGQMLSVVARVDAN